MIKEQTMTQKPTTDMETRLERANKQELRDMVRMYRFIALSRGCSHEMLDQLEADSVQLTRIG